MKHKTLLWTFVGIAILLLIAVPALYGAFRQQTPQARLGPVAGPYHAPVGSTQYPTFTFTLNTNHYVGACGPFLYKSGNVMHFQKCTLTKEFVLQYLNQAVPTPVPTPTPVPQPTTDPGTTYGSMCDSGNTQACQMGLLQLMNNERASHGISPLMLNATESSGTTSCVGAYGHAVHMAMVGQISHDQFPGDICLPLCTGFTGTNPMNLSKTYSSASNNILQFHAGLSQANYISDLFNGIFARSISSPIRLPSFGNHILHIILLSAQKQVVRVNTKTIIALMKNEHAFGYFSLSDNPRYSIGGHRFSVKRIDSPVGFFVTTTGPHPTIGETRILIYMGPETISQIEAMITRGARSLIHGNSPNQEVFSSQYNTCYSTAGENVGEASGDEWGATVQDFDLMIAEPYSPSYCATTDNHHCNIDNPSYSQVGIGIFDNGTTYQSVDFVG